MRCTPEVTSTPVDARDKSLVDMRHEAKKQGQESPPETNGSPTIQTEVLVVFES